jgi:hypothetical protein
MATKTTTKWKTSDVSRIGRGALALALEERAALKPRLAPGLLDGLSADLDACEGKRSAATLASEALREATRYPDVARGAGLLPSDLDHARALRTALVAADAAQEAKKQSRKTPTAERTQLQRRIEQAVDAIVAAGTLAFVLDPTRAARFRALVPSYGKGKGKRSPAAPATTPA